MTGGRSMHTASRTQCETGLRVRRDYSVPHMWRLSLAPVRHHCPHCQACKGQNLPRGRISQDSAHSAIWCSGLRARCTPRWVLAIAAAHGQSWLTDGRAYKTIPRCGHEIFSRPLTAGRTTTQVSTRVFRSTSQVRFEWTCRSFRLILVDIHGRTNSTCRLSFQLLLFEQRIF